MTVWIIIHMLFHSELMHILEIVQSLTLSITKFCTYHIRSAFHEVLRFLLYLVWYLVKNLGTSSYCYLKIKQCGFQLTFPNIHQVFHRVSRYTLEEGHYLLLALSLGEYGCL